MKPRLIEYHHAILSHPPPPLISCGGIVPAQSLQQQKQELFHRNFQQSFWDVAFLATLSRKSAPLPQKGPIYYVNAESPDHAEKCENKTAGRQLVDFRKSRLWLTPAA